MDLTEKIASQIKLTTEKTALPGERIQGKVRDIYPRENYVVFVSTDRLSAFDRVLCGIPFKGIVLNLTSQWWFEKTKHIIPNHVVDVPDPAVTVGKKCDVFTVEFVVRGYMTGSTNTSLWTHYKDGSRNYCGNALPDGMVKNQKLAENILTPTTKDKDHDLPISAEEILATGRMSKEDWDVCSKAALELFNFGQKVAAEHGLILVDTKYEFGKDADGNILLIDEIHTPDSSRYWIADTYEERFAKGENPQNIDKEFIRLWYRDNCDPYKDEVLPQAPDEQIIELSRRYIYLYEKITGQEFPFPDLNVSPAERIAKNLAGYFSA